MNLLLMHYQRTSFLQYNPIVFIVVNNTMEPTLNRRLLQLLHLVARKPKTVFAAIKMFTHIQVKTIRNSSLTKLSTVQNSRKLVNSKRHL